MQEVTADRDEVMRAELGVERLSDAWQKIIASAGPLQAIGHDDKISGLFVLVPDAP